MKKLIFRALVLYLLAHFIALTACPICGGFDQTFFKVNSVKFVNYEKPDDNSIYTLNELTENESVSVTDYVLAIELEVEYFTDAMPSFENPFVQSAWACSPPSPEPTEKITDMNITSIANLVTFHGDTLEAGTSLNDVFFSDFRVESVSTLLSKGDWEPLDSDYGYERLLLDAIPADPSKPHQFSIVYELDNEKIFTAISLPVFLYF